MLKNSFRIAIKALASNKLKTGLAMLGMTIGVAAVLTMFALGTGAQESISSEVKSAGTTLIYVKAGNFTRGGEQSKIATGMGSASTLTADDAYEISKIDGIGHIAAGIRARGWVAYGGERNYGQILGTDYEYPLMYDFKMQKGKFFKQADVANSNNVAVLGSVLRDQLFGEGVNPVGKTITVRDKEFTVVGVFTTSDEEQGQMVFVPYPVLQTMMGFNYITNITIAAAQAGDASRIAGEIAPLLRKRHKLDAAAPRKAGDAVNVMPGAQFGTPDDFTVTTQAQAALTKGLTTSVSAFILANMPSMDQVNMQEMSGTLSRAGSTMTALLGAIATISLIVGGIGIMNIMLVSVTERTREIGIRRAVGARSYDVLMQFLVEAVTLALMGGVLGIILGFIASFIITHVLQWPATVSASAVALAFGIAGATGIFFGFYPARRASVLNPINALRYE
jgi:ABC-type antimicrobial peptide transport system permease subunit